MKKTFLATLALMSASLSASADVIAIADPGSTVSEIGTRIRWGGTGFEASIFDSSSLVQTPTLNPVGTPVWNPVAGAPHKFEITFDNVTGALSLSVDFNRDLVFGQGESITRSVFEAPGQTSYVCYGFKYLSISGNESGSAGRSSVGNLIINGTPLANITPGGLFLENYYKDSSGNPLTIVTITGEMDFIVAGTSQERPSWNFRFKNAVFNDITPPTITCPPAVSVDGAAPAAATTVAEFLAQGGTITTTGCTMDDGDLNGTVTSSDLALGFCPTIITRTYVVTDTAGNKSLPCEQIITVNNLFAGDGIVWH